MKDGQRIVEEVEEGVFGPNEPELSDGEVRGALLALYALRCAYGLVPLEDDDDYEGPLEEALAKKLAQYRATRRSTS